MKKYTLAILVSSVMPVVSYAVTPLESLVTNIGGWIGNLIPIVSALAVLYFFWGLAKYILSAGDEKKAEEGRSIMIWGTIALFVMLSIYGIVGFIQNTLGVGGNANVGGIYLPIVTIP